MSLAICSGALLCASFQAKSAASGAPPHVFLLLMENSAAPQAASTPYVASLMSRYATAVNYSGVTDPSLPNYLAITSGQWADDQGGDDPANAPYAVDNLFNQLEQFGISWGAYADGYPENIPSPLDYLTLETNGYGFAGHHFPALFYSDVVNSAAAMSHLGSWSQLQALLAGPDSGVPDFVWVTPTVNNADNPAGMEPYVDAITSSAAWKAGGVLIVTWDNQAQSSGTLAGFTQAPATTTGGGNVLALVISPNVAPGTTYTEPLSHYSTLQAIEQAYGLPLLGNAATAPAWTQLESLLESPSAPSGPTAIQLSPGPESVTVGSTVTIAGTVTVPTGGDPAGWTIDLRATSGSVTATAKTGPSGTFSAVFTAPHAPGEVGVTASVVGTDPPMQATASLQVAAGAPASVTAQLEPPSVAPSGSVTVAGLVEDAFGNPVDGASVAAAIGGDTVATGSTGSDGRYSVDLAAPASPGSYTVGVAVSGSPSVTATAPLQVTEGPAATVTVALTPPSAQPGASVTVQGVVEDAEGDGLANQAVAVAVGPGEPVRASTAAGGAYELSVSAPTQAGTYPVTVEVGNGSVQGQATLVVVAGPARSVTLHVTPRSEASGGSVSASGTVTDAYGNSVQGQVVDVAVGSAPSTAATTGVDGVFSATVAVPSTPGSYTATVTVPGEAVDATAPVTVTAGAPTSITATVVPASVQAGAEASVAGSVTDAQGDAVADAPVDVSVAGGPPVPATTDAQGAYSAQITAPVVPGPYRVAVTVPGAVAAATATLTVTAGAPAAVTASLSPPTVASGGTVTASGAVTDAHGDGVPHQTVHVSVGGEPVTGTTDAQGAYSVQIAAPEAPGLYTVNVTVPGTSAAVSAPLTVTAGAPTTVTATLAPPSVTAGGTVTASGTVADAHGDGVADEAVQVSVAGGTPVAGTTGTDGAYSIQVPAPEAPGPYTVTVTVPGTSASVSAQLTVTAGAPTTVTATLTPPSVTAGGTVTASGTVVDAHGDGVADEAVQVSVAGGAPVAGTTGADGNYSIQVPAPEVPGPYTVTVTVPGTSAAASAPLTVAAGVPTTVTAALVPPSVTAGGTVTAAGTVADAHGDGVADQAVQVSLAGGAPVAGTTGADGNYSIQVPAPEVPGPYTVTVTVPGTSAAASAPLTVNAGAPSTVTATLVPPSVTAGGSVTASGTVADAHGDGVADQVVQVAVAGGQAVTGSTNAVGGYSIRVAAPEAAGPYTVTVTVPGSTAEASATLTVQAPAVGAVTETLVPATVLPGGSVTASGVVSGIPASSGPTVEVTLGGGPPVAAEVGSAGQYSAALTAPSTSGEYGVTATVPGTEAQATATLTVQTAPPPTITERLGGNSVPAGGTVTVAGTVTDASGAGIAGRVVSITAGDDPSVSATTGAGGAYATTLTAPDAAATYTVTASLAGSVPSASEPLIVTGGPAADITAAVSPASATAGSGVAVSGAVSDAYGNPLAGQLVDIALNGSTATAMTAGDGSYSASLDAPTAVGTYPVAVAVQGAGATQTVSLLVTPAAAASATLTVTPASITAGGTVDASGVVLDAEGNAVPGQQMTLSVGTGPAVIANTDASGAFQAHLTAPDAAGSYTVTAIGSSVSATAALTVTAPSASGGGGVPAFGGFGGAPVGAGRALGASGGGGANGPSSAPNVPVHQTAQGVTETVNTAAGPVTVATANAAFAFVLAPDSMPADTSIQVAQAAPSSLPAVPDHTTVASAVWSVNTGGVEPTAPVAATFAYQLPAGVSSAQLGLYTLVGGKWQFYTGGHVNAATGTLTATLPHLSTWAVLANNMTFPDVPATSWAFRDVEELTAAGIVSGLPDGTFGPDASVTRGAFLKMLLGALGIAPHVDATQPFVDVSSSQWDAGYADAAEAVGILQGNGGSALLGQDVTRQEAAVLMMRGLAYANATVPAGTPPTLSDASSVASWAAPDVTKALADRLLHGYPDGTFRPLATLTRAEAAAMAEAVAQLVQAR